MGFGSSGFGAGSFSTDTKEKGQKPVEQKKVQASNKHIQEVKEKLRDLKEAMLNKR